MANQSNRSAGRRTARLVLAVATCVPLSVAVCAVRTGVAQAQTADPAAVLAAAALSSLASRGAVVAAVGADVAQPVASPAVQPLAGPANAGPAGGPSGQVQPASPPAGGATSPTGGAQPGVPQVTLLTPADGTNWSSYVVDSASVGRPAPTTVPAPSTVAVTTTSTSVAPSTTVAVQAVGTGGSADYAVARQRLARALAERTKGLDAAELDAAWARTDERRLIAVYSALAQLGTPYRYTGNEPGGFDCSGLTSYAWSRAGVRLPRISTDQINAAAPRAAGQLSTADLVWRPGHVMLYLGVGDFIVDSPQTGKAVGVKRWGRVSRFGSPI